MSSYCLIQREAGCNESRVWQPVASGFCIGASGLCPLLAWRASESFGEISNGHIEFQFKSYSIQLKTCKQKSRASWNGIQASTC